MGKQTDPFGALTDQAEGFDIPGGDLAEYLPPFAAGVTMVAGRALALLAYRDSDRWGDRPLVRGDDDARGTVLALMPPACDGQGADFRRRAARAFWDLAEDLAAGRAPLARCAAESWALQVMLEHAPRMCAATDAELRTWGVDLPDGDDYDPPDFDEQPYMLVIEGAEITIPEARDAADGGQDAEDDDAEQEGGWSGPRYWFSPYGITVPREPQRGHPSPGALASAGPTPERAHELLHLDQGSAADGMDGDGRGHLNDDDQYAPGALAAILTPQAADLLAVAADHVADSGWHDLFRFGDRVVERPEDDNEDEDDDWGEDSFLLDLPALCDGQSAAWRLAMVRAVENLAGDLRARRAPIPTCTAEELAFHLILHEAEVVLDYLEDEEYAREVGLPPGRDFSARHRTFDVWRECFLQDEDVLIHYDERLQHVATDPDHPASRHLGTGDLRPRSWFTPFGNVRPRPVRRLEPDLLERLATADPEAFFDSTPALRHQPLPAAPPTAVALPEGLREEFETFVGLAQRRFFDEPTAIAMATSLDRLLTRFFSVPQVVPFRIWPLNPRASAVKAGLLIVDDDFCLQGLEHTWRLSADRTDRDARRWATELVQDCANYALNNWNRGPWDMLRGPDEPAPDPLDPDVTGILEPRLRDLARDMTAAGLLRHRMDEMALTTADLEALSMLPQPLVASWSDGAEMSPSQIMRCAPALQLSEDVLLDALNGKRDTEYWPLPEPPLDCIGIPERSG